MANPKKRERKKFIIRKIIFFSIFLFLLFLFFLLRFHIYRVEIVGNNALDAKEILYLTKIKPKDYLVFINSNDIKNRLEKLPKIKKVEIYREFPYSLSLKITERKPEVLLHNKMKFYVLDKEGVVIDIVENLCKGIPFVSGVNLKKISSGDIIKEKQIEQIMKILKFSKKILPLKIFKISFENKNKIFVYLNNGFWIKIGEGSYIEEKMEKSCQILKKIREENLPIKYINIEAKDNPAGGTI